MANKICLITNFVEKRKGGFGVSRLIMLSGVPVRNFSRYDPDPPTALERVRQVLPQILTEQELQDLETFLSEAEHDTLDQRWRRG